MLIRLLVAAFLVLAAPATARDLTAAEREGFAAAMANYQQAFRDGDAAALAALLPTRVIDRIVGGGVDGDARRDAIVASVQAWLNRETLMAFEIHADRAEFAAIPDGRPVGLAPMVHVAIRRDGEPIEVKRPVNGQMKMVKLVTEYETTVWSHILGIFEDGQWSLVSLIDGDTVEALFEVYPVFKERGLPRARAQMHARSVQVE